MKNLCILGLASLLALPAAAAEPVAIVYSLAGEASLTAPVHRPLRLFDRLPAGTIVEVNPGSRLALAFVNGLRYELGELSRVTIGRKNLVSRTGPVRSLPQVPRLPRLSPIASEDRPGPRAGAVRIRTETVKGLYPDRAAASLASATRLRFDPVPAAPGYIVQIVDQTGETVFQIDTQATEVSVPPGVLKPGETYRWSVETRDRPGAIARGEATLVTLDDSRARAREELRRWAEQSGNMDDQPLLAAVDQALGLAEDARCLLSMPGVVVETVTPESAAFHAGLAPGDRLLSWCRVREEKKDCIVRGDLRTPFDWLDVHMEDVQLGGVVIEGMRGTESRRWNLLPISQGLTVTPLFQGALAEAYQSSLAGDPASAAGELERAATLADEYHCADSAIWLLARAAQLRAQASQWTEADAGYRSALTKARSLGATRVEPHLLMGWSEALLRRGDLPQARQQLERALLIEQDRPESLGVPTVLTRLGNVAEKQDDLDEADRLYRRAFELTVRLASGNGPEAAAANNLAVIAGRRGDLAQAEQYAARALAIRERLAPTGPTIISSLLSYGNVTYARGDYAGAEAAFLRARKILEKIRPDSVELATTLHNLGVLADERHDDESAESFFGRELAIFERIDPSGNLVRDSLMGLGEVALRQGRGDKAEESWRRALTIAEKLNPTGPKSASCLRGLAEAARLQGKGKEAEELLRSALAIWQKINPESYEAGFIHLQLGILFFEQQHDELAELHLRTAIRLQEKYRRPLPEGFHALARLQARTGQLAEASETYQEAVDALEAQSANLGGAQESQWFYDSSLGDLYFEAAEHQITLARPREAWQLIERGRARGFKNLLAQRDLRFAGELPADLYAERRRLAAEYDRVQALLADWTVEQGLEQMEELQGRLRDLRLEQAKIQERVRLSSPRIGALESPSPLDLAAARAALDPGTVLLTYSIGEKRSFLFVLEPEGAPGPGLSFHPLAIGREDLTREVEAFRSLLGRPDTLLSALKERGQHLYDLLVRPAEPVLGKADRWLISPDGPLHSLPFAALVSDDRYLAESKPIHIAASAAIYKEIKATRSKEPSTMATELLAAGDPLYSETASDPQLQAALRRGVKLEPLPATRREVGAISGFYPDASILLGRNATEEAIKSLAPRARRLHFACHGLLDEQFPLNSALAFSIPEHPEEGRDNGLLQAWEVLEDLRLDADLVTLSACDSGLGKEMGSEGLVGLVRAFQFAGARSVLASLWSVSDTSTADLMMRFYRFLREGRSKDKALREAQADLIRSRNFSHPYYWAAFQLTGDWR
jgi:CHAT domain-containing protein/tetratricopeptide (TPR) repeat protein